MDRRRIHSWTSPRPVTLLLAALFLSTKNVEMMRRGGGEASAGKRGYTVLCSSFLSSRNNTLREAPIPLAICSMYEGKKPAYCTTSTAARTKDTISLTFNSFAPTEFPPTHTQTTYKRIIISYLFWVPVYLINGTIDAFTIIHTKQLVTPSIYAIVRSIEWHANNALTNFEVWKDSIPFAFTALYMYEC